MAEVIRRLMDCPKQESPTHEAFMAACYEKTGSVGDDLQAIIAFQDTTCIPLKITAIDQKIYDQQLNPADN